MGVGRFLLDTGVEAAKWKMMGPGARGTHNRLAMDAALQHQRHQISAVYNGPKEEQAAAERAAKEQQRQHEAWEKQRRAELAEQEKAAWREWAAAPRYSGGNSHPDPIRVLHHRAGKVPVAVLPPPDSGDPALINGARALVHQRPELATDERFMEKARLADAAWPDVRSRYGSLLAAIRDEAWWASVCAPVAAGTPHVAIRVDSEHAWTGQYATGREKIVTYDLPVVAGLKVAGDGLRIRIAPRVGDNGARWKKSLEHIRAAFKAVGAPAGNMSITEDGSGAIVIRLNDRDPLSDAVQIDHIYDPERFRSLLGVTASGEPAWITWKGSSGLVVGGVPGSGKTASMLPVFAAMRGEVELHIFDGKSGFDLHPLRHIAATYDRSGDVAAPLETLRRLDRLRVERAEALYAREGINNFWNSDLATRRRLGVKPVFVVLDEVQTWTDTGGMDKATKAVAEEITALIRTLIQKGRSAGIVTILTTQKPDATTIPTKVRDNAALKLAFKVSTPEQAITILGKQAPDAPDPTEIPMSAKGRFVMETEGQGTILGQAGYRDPDDLESELADAEPVEDQAAVAERLTAPEPTTAPVLTVVPDVVEPAPVPTPDPLAALIPSAEEIAQMTVAERIEVMRLVAQLRGSDPAPVVEVPAAMVEPSELVKPTRRTRAAKTAETVVNDTPDF
nr:FtsK/SpoIIIE domain-containing protein [Mycolicibacterium brumae]